MIWLDLDRFKEVNDTLGHSTGDALLKSVAERLQSCVRGEDTVARLGGDEFAIIQIGTSQPRRRHGARHAPDRGDRRAVPDQRPSDHRRDQRRHLHRAGGLRECRPAAEERRPRALSGQERRPRHLPLLRAGDGRAHAYAPPAGDRPARGGRQRRLRAALSAHPGCGEQQDHRPRGPAALEPSRARPDRSGRFHPAGRGDRADRGDRRVGAAHGLRAGDEHAAAGEGRGQPVRAAVRTRRLGAAGDADAGRPPASTPGDWNWKSPSPCCWRTPTRC